MKSRISVLQKIIISIFVAILLINCIVPIISTNSQVLAKGVRLEKWDDDSGVDGKLVKEGDKFYRIYFENGQAYGEEYQWTNSQDVSGFTQETIAGWDSSQLQNYLGTFADYYKPVDEDSAKQHWGVGNLTAGEFYTHNVQPTDEQIEHGMGNSHNGEVTEDTGSKWSIGGILLDPVVDLICGLGDFAVNFLQWSMVEQPKGKTFKLGSWLVDSKKYGQTEAGKEQLAAGTANSPSKAITTVNADELDKGWQNMHSDYYVPLSRFSPEEIFAGKVPALDIDFINPHEKDGTPAGDLHETIAGWYIALRNLAIVGLLSVLVYVGIRIIISSTAADKAKYKQLLIDWLIALCLLFFLHYIMSFTITIVDSICEAMSGGSNFKVDTIHITVDDGTSFNTNLLGYARFMVQNKDLGTRISYLIMYVALIIYTVIFTIFYLRRVLTIAFLTMIAPLVALTYPIDKISDGKAQAFDSWLKEYVYNVLIQPFHLIIYMVLVQSAINLATTNILYMIAALGFILPAEKILRSFFGFNKASAGTMGALHTIGLASMINKVTGGGKKPLGQGNGSKKEEEGEKPIRYQSKHDIAGLGAYDNGGTLGDGTEQQTDPVMDRYSSEGFRQNANGEYFNPFTGEYDPDYDPHNDQSYTAAAQQAQQTQQQQEQREQQAVEQAMREQEQHEQQQSVNARGNLNNWLKGHGITGASIGRGAWSGAKRMIGGTAKFATKHAFRGAAGTLAGAIALASGGGMEGFLGSYIAAANMGEKLGNQAIKLESSIGNNAAGAVERVALAGHNARKYGKDFGEELLGGSKLGKEIDLWNGNSHYGDYGDYQRRRNSKDTIKYFRDDFAAKNGKAPTAEDEEKFFREHDIYFANNLNVKEAMKGRKIAKDYGLDDGYVALSMAIGKERNVTADMLGDKKKAAEFQDRTTQELMRKLPEAVAKRQAETLTNLLKEVNGVSNTLKKANSRTLHNVSGIDGSRTQGNGSSDSGTIRMR